jgi:hypothetical protein
MAPRPHGPLALLLIRAWLEPSAQQAGADAVRARVTVFVDVLTDEGDSFVLAGTDAVVAAVESWLAEFATVTSA